MKRGLSMGAFIAILIAVLVAFSVAK